ncbi:MAG: hypothetical protein ACREEM_21760 [Blastocatellia bacterium]
MIFTPAFFFLRRALGRLEIPAAILIERNSLILRINRIEFRRGSGFRKTTPIFFFSIRWPYLTVCRVLQAVHLISNATRGYSELRFTD